MTISTMFVRLAKKHYDSVDSRIRSNYLQEWLDNAYASLKCAYCLGSNLIAFFSSDAEAAKLAVMAWKQGIAWHRPMISYLSHSGRKNTKREIKLYTANIKKYDLS